MTFNDCGTDSETNLVDLAPPEQISRGQELLQMLQNIQAPEVPQQVPPKTVQTPRTQESNVKVCVRNTFIQLVASPCRNGLKRSASEGTILNRHIHAASQSQKLEDEPHVLSLNSCISEGHDSASASTGTPRESVEDFSVHEVADVSLRGDFVTEDAADMCWAQGSFTECSTYQPEDSWNYYQSGQEWVPTQHQDSACMYADFCIPATDSLSQSMEAASSYDGYEYMDASFMGTSTLEDACLYTQHGQGSGQQQHQIAAYLGVPLDLASAHTADSSTKESIWPSPWEWTSGAMAQDSTQYERYNAF